MSDSTLEYLNFSFLVLFRSCECENLNCPTNAAGTLAEYRLKRFDISEYLIEALDP